MWHVIFVSFVFCRHHEFRYPPKHTCEHVLNMNNMHRKKQTSPVFVREKECDEKKKNKEIGCPPKKAAIVTQMNSNQISMEK